jgi:hypothetical protein
MNAMSDRQIKNIIVVWHWTYSERSWYKDHVDTFDIWVFDKDHLKDGVFVNAGCSIKRKDSYLPLWSFACTSDKGLWWFPSWKCITKHDIKSASFVNQPIDISKMLKTYDMRSYNLVKEHFYLSYPNYPYKKFRIPLSSYAPQENDLSREK